MRRAWWRYVAYSVICRKSYSSVHSKSNACHRRVDTYGRVVDVLGERRASDDRGQGIGLGSRDRIRLHLLVSNSCLPVFHILFSHHVDAEVHALYIVAAGAVPKQTKPYRHRVMGIVSFEAFQGAVPPRDPSSFDRSPILTIQPCFWLRSTVLR